jgi:predicted nucleotidyltransferase component of viral defense system
VITKEELQRQAAQAGVRAQLQERDYALGWFLLGLAQSPRLAQDLAFKGGTALRKTYLPDYRFSEDLDFTLLASLDEHDLQAGIATVLQRVGQLSGMRMWVAHWRQKRAIADEQAYQARVAYVGPLGQGSSPPRISLDLTRYEHVALDLVPRAIIHPYSDAPASPQTVLTYCLEEMLAEKLRALLRRSYPRDVYDVWYLLKHRGQNLDRQRLLRALTAKCRYKGYEFSSAEDFMRLAQHKGMAAAWEASLGHLVSFTPPFESVVAELEGLLTDWL